MTQALMTESERKLILWSLLATLISILLLITWMGIARVNKPVNSNFFGLAIKGYDPVAYFTEDRAVEGDSQFKAVWKDARWRFASAEHRDLFKADPERYAPQYGGFCAAYLAEGGVTRVDPEAWAIIDGKLYLHSSKEERDKLMAEDTAAKIKRADAEWARRQNRW